MQEYKEKPPYSNPSEGIYAFEFDGIPPAGMPVFEIDGKKYALIADGRLENGEGNGVGDKKGEK